VPDIVIFNSNFPRNPKIKTNNDRECSIKDISELKYFREVLYILLRRFYAKQLLFYIGARLSSDYKRE